MIYRKSVQTLTYEADFRNRLRLTTLLNYMQEAAAVNADQLGFGYHDLQEKGLFWVLSRTRIIMESYPAIGEEMIVETWPKDLHSLFALRDFRFSGKDGKIFGKATTAWIIMNQNTHRPLRPDSIMEDNTRYPGLHAIQEVPGKLDALDSLTQVNEIRASYSDIDVNRHVNNVKYLQYILDSYPDDELLTLDIKDFQINFLTECKMGDIIRIFRSTQGPFAYFEGQKLSGEKAFQAVIM